MLTRTDFFAFGAAVAVSAGWFWWGNAVRDATPASEWFEVKTLSVPDFLKGENPVIAYDRVIHKSFPGTYKIEITAASERGAIVCQNSRSVDYKAGRELPAAVTVSWLFGDAEWPACSSLLVEGSYIIRVAWDINEPGYPVKTYHAVGNVFRVFPAGSQLYVNPEQLQKIEEQP